MSTRSPRRRSPAAPAWSARLATPHGILGGQPQSTLFLCIGVDDVAAAVERVRAAGGKAGDPHLEPYGMVAGCVDDQGVEFALLELSAAAPRPGSASGRQGDV